MDVVTASNELFDSLREYKEVVGTAVEKKNNIDYIIVYLSKATKFILQKIPSTYKGNRVKPEVTGDFFI